MTAKKSYLAAICLGFSISCITAITPVANALDEGDDPCYQDLDQQRRRIPSQLDIHTMRKRANAITSIPWQVDPDRDTGPKHCAYNGGATGDKGEPYAPELWPGENDNNHSPKEIGVPYKWGGFDMDCEFACFHDPKRCSVFQSSDFCSKTIKPHSHHSSQQPARSAGLHESLADSDTACTTGVDCSGLVSSAWGIPWKMGTPKSGDKENWCTLRFAAHEVATSKVSYTEKNGKETCSIDDESFWEKLQPGDALVMPGHVVLVDYPIGKDDGTSGACVWEASGHHRIPIGNTKTYKYMEETAHHGKIDDNWLCQQHHYQVVVLRFDGTIVGTEPKLPPVDSLCESRITYHGLDAPASSKP